VPAPHHRPSPVIGTPSRGLEPDQCRSLLDYLAGMPDPRQRRGRRHPLAGVLGVAVYAVLAGARSLTAIGEWASDAPSQVLAALGVRCDPWTGVWRPPGEATVRRVLARIDPTRWTRSSAGGWPTSSHRNRPPGRHRHQPPGHAGRSRSTARPCAAARGVRKCVHAARRYSCRRPPSRSRQWTRAGGWPLLRVTAAAGSGGSSCSARWGR
jgi:hypothetical protein